MTQKERLETLAETLKVGFEINVFYHVYYKGETHVCGSLRDFLEILWREKAITDAEFDYLVDATEEAYDTVESAGSDLSEALVDALEQCIDEEASDEEDAA